MVSIDSKRWRCIDHRRKKEKTILKEREYDFDGHTMKNTIFALFLFPSKFYKLRPDRRIRDAFKL